MLAIPRKQRAMVRKGIKAGLRAEIDPHADRLYRSVFRERAQSRHAGVRGALLREPAAGRSATTARCSRSCTQGARSSSVLSFYFRDEVLPYYGGGIAAARELAGNDFMYWELMRRACAARSADLRLRPQQARHRARSTSRSTGASSRQPLHYEYYLVKARELPNLSPTNPKYQLFIARWRRLPLPVSPARSAPTSRGVSADGAGDVLFLAHRIPYPPDKGDKIRSLQPAARARAARTACTWARSSTTPRTGRTPERCRSGARASSCGR